METEATSNTSTVSSFSTSTGCFTKTYKVCASKCGPSLRTVDGRNPVKSPVEVGSLCHYLKGFIHPKRGCLGFIPSTGSFRGLLCFLGVCVCFTYCPILFKVEKQNIEGSVSPQVEHPKSYNYSKLAMAKK